MALFSGSSEFVRTKVSWPSINYNVPLFFFPVDLCESRVLLKNYDLGICSIGCRAVFLSSKESAF